MSVRLQHFTNVMIPIVNAAYARGLINKAAPWLPLRTERFVRFHANIDGDIPAVVDIGRWEDGLSNIYWALWPTASDVVLEQPYAGGPFPGEVWGWGELDRRWDLRLSDPVDYHCSKSRKRRVARIPRVPLNAAFTTGL